MPRFELSEDEQQELLEPFKMTSWGEAAVNECNLVWARLGEKLGFNWKTVKPDKHNPRKFTADIAR